MEAATMETNITRCRAGAGKYLTFNLNGEEYGLEILKVKEIIGLMDITSLPQTPDFVKGVINLRGKVIPVVDLRLRFQLNEAEHTEKTCIIVVEVESENRYSQIGIVVDSVSEVLQVQEDDLQATPSFGVNIDTSYILGMAKSQNRIRTLLDINRVLMTDDMVNIINSAK